MHWERTRDRAVEDPERLWAENDLARALTDNGDFAAALPLYTEALEVRRRTQGDRHKNTLVAICNLASLYEAMGELKKSYTLSKVRYLGVLSPGRFLH